MPVGHIDTFCCLEINALKRYPDHDEALALLKRVAAQVQPIMRRRRWTVVKLSEFFPKNPRLYGLNCNKGQHVKVRLRRAGGGPGLLDWNTVLGTMLHELVHNDISAHNAAFYKLLDELWEEVEALMDKGISGCGAFDGPSVGRLGAHGWLASHNPPEQQMGDAIRKAAEARARTQSIMVSGPRKLGGSTARGLTPAQAAAAAAERRARDNEWCPAEHDAEQLAEEAADADGEAAGGAGAGSSGGSSGGGGSGRAGSAPPTSAAAAAPPLQQQQLGRQQQRQQPQQQQSQAAPPPALPPEVVAVQQAALQQDWAQHLQRQREQRKRRATVTIDLTASDNEGSDGGDDAFASCPCCAAGLAGDDASAAAAAAAAAGGRSAGFRQWCAQHRQQQQWQQQQQQQQQQRRPPGSWACPVCTLVNRGGAQQCDACLSERPAASL